MSYRNFSAPSVHGRTLVAALLLTFSLHPSRAATTPLDPITVESKREREKLVHDVDQFVSSAMTHYWDRPLLRWSTPICPLVAGMPREDAEFMLRRLSQTARDASAPLGSEKCRANFLILVSNDPEQLLRKLRDRKPMMFNLHDGEGTVQHFLKTDRPIRVWYNWEFDGAYDSALATGSTISGTNSPTAAGTAGAYPVRSSAESRMRYSAGRTIDTAIVAVDFDRVKNINIGQLTDYIAMIGMAEINLDKQIVNAPTVLALFDASAGAPTEGMSSWDKALLHAVYTSDLHSMMPLSQVETHAEEVLVPH